MTPAMYSWSQGTRVSHHWSGRSGSASEISDLPYSPVAFAWIASSPDMSKCTALVRDRCSRLSFSAFCKSRLQGCSCASARSCAFFPFSPATDVAEFASFLVSVAMIFSCSSVLS